MALRETWSSQSQVKASLTASPFSEDAAPLSFASQSPRAAVLAIARGIWPLGFSARTGVPVDVRTWTSESTASGRAGGRYCHTARLVPGPAWSGTIGLGRSPPVPARPARGLDAPRSSGQSRSQYSAVSEAVYSSPSLWRPCVSGEWCSNDGPHFWEENTLDWRVPTSVGRDKWYWRYRRSRELQCFRCLCG